MTNPFNRTAVTDGEQLARFILFSKWIRDADQTVKPDAFIPHPYPDLSVTRHKNLSDPEIWQTGQAVAKARPAKLYGRADLRAIEVRRYALEVKSKPMPDNPNHANVVGWPVEKSAQKSIAQQISAGRRFVPKPILAA